MKPVISFLLFSFIAAPCAVLAQKAPDYGHMTLEDLLNVKVTTASKLSQRAGEAPATVIVITAEQIKTRRYRNLAEVLNDLPDVKVNDKSDPQFYNSFNMRGINRQDRFVILLDGIKISSPTNDALPILENFPIYLAKQVEVVFGPGSALYGADAMSGVINIITEKENTADRLQATVMAGTQGYSNQHLYFRKKFDKGFNLSAGLQYSYDKQPDFSKVYPSEYNMQGQRTGLFNSAYGPMSPAQPLDPGYEAPIKTYNGYLALEKGGFDFKLLHHYAQVPTSTTLKPENGVYNKDVFYGHGLTTANLSYTDSIGQVKSTTSVQGSFYEVNPKSNYRNLYGRMEHGYKYNYGTMIKLDEQVGFTVSEKLNAMAGLTYELFHALPKSVEMAEPYRRGTAVQGILLNSPYYYNPRGIDAKFYTLTYHNIGSFVQGQYTPYEKLAITLGLRLDDNSRFGSTLNPRLGLVYKPSGKTTIKALYGTAYWAPSPQTTYEQYGSFYSVDSGRTYRADFLHLPNPGLKPSTSETFELSLNHTINKRLNLSLTGYYTKIRSVITDAADNGNTNLYNNSYLGYPVGYVEVPFNAGVQQTYGANFILNSLFNIGRLKLNTWTSLSWVDGTITEYASSSQLIKTELPLIAPWQFRAGVDGHAGDFNFSVRMLHSGKQRVTGYVNPGEAYARQEIPGYTLVNASVGYEWRNNFSFFVRAQNALNARYRLPIYVDLNDANSSIFPGSFQDPVRFVAGLSVSF